MKVVLLDTGPLVALLDAADPLHEAAKKGFAALSGQLVTSGAVVTEVFHYLAPFRKGPEKTVAVLGALGVRVVDVFDAISLTRISSVMEKYRDVPMDFADGTLVLLAEEFATPDILTFVERGFRTFRFAKKRPFHLLLDDIDGLARP